MNQEEELNATFIEEYSSANILRDMGNLKSAVILLSKSLFALCDYILLKKYGKVPKNHSERFRILEFKEKEVFSEVDSMWSKYTDTYSKPSNEESFLMINKTIKRIADNEESCKGVRAVLKD